MGCPKSKGGAVDGSASAAGSAAGAAAGVSLTVPAPAWEGLSSKRRLELPDQAKGANRVIALPGNLLLVHEGTGWSVFPRGARKPTAHLAEKADYKVRENVAGHYLLRGEPSGLVTVYDARTLTSVWTYATPNFNPNHAYLVEDGKTLLVELGKDSAVLSDIAVAFDVATGATKWSVPLSASTSNHASYGGGRFLIALPEVTTALDVATGKPLWTRPHSGTHGEFYSFVGKKKIVGRYGEIIDAATGKDLAKLDVPELGVTDVVPGDESIAYSLQTTFQGSLFAIDLVHDKLLWKTEFPRMNPDMPRGKPTPVELAASGTAFATLSGSDQRYYGNLLVPDARAVFTMREDGILRAFDRLTGKERWSWSLLGTDIAVFPDRPFTLYAVQDGAVIALEDGNTSVEHATITGTLTEQGKPSAGQDIWVGPTKTKTDAEGRFKATYDGRGDVRVIVHNPAPMPPGTNPGLGLGLGRTHTRCSLDGEQLVFLFGQGTYDVKVEALVDCQTSALQ